MFGIYVRFPKCTRFLPIFMNGKPHDSLHSEHKQTALSKKLRLLWVWKQYFVWMNVPKLVYKFNKTFTLQSMYGKFTYNTCWGPMRTDVPIFSFNPTFKNIPLFNSYSSPSNSDCTKKYLLFISGHVKKTRVSSKSCRLNGGFLYPTSQENLAKLNFPGVGHPPFRLNQQTKNVPT